MGKGVGGIGAKARWLNWLCGIRARSSAGCGCGGKEIVRLKKNWCILDSTILEFRRKASEQK